MSDNIHALPGGTCVLSEGFLCKQVSPHLMILMLTAAHVGLRIALASSTDTSCSSDVSFAAGARHLMLFGQRRTPNATPNARATLRSLGKEESSGTQCKVCSRKASCTAGHTTTCGCVSEKTPESL